jgi:two-component system, LytTR family, response regulator
MLNCVIVDDEPLGINVLKQYISKTPFLELKGAFTNPIEALAYLQNQSVDLVFLDIEMEELSGLQFLQMIPAEISVIIVSAYSQYAIDGYEYDAVGYLLKPVVYEKFYALSQKVSRLKLEKRKPQKTEISSGFSKYLFIKDDNVMVRVDTSDILFVEGMRNYLSIHTSAKKYVTYSSMKSIEDLLSPDMFFRIQKSFIVALDKIDKIERNRIYIKDKIIPIGETYAQEFFKLIDSKRP